MKINQCDQWYKCKIPFRIYLLIFFFIATHFYTLSAQNVTLSSTNQTIKSAFTEIEKQTNMSVDYDETILDANKKISSSIQNKPLREALEIILKETGCHYTITGSHIVIYEIQAKERVANRQVNRISITGMVVDANGEPIIGANVVEKGTTNGVITDIDGKFSLQVSGNAVLQISYIGYVTQEIPVRNQRNFTIKLLEDFQVLDEVVVVGYGIQKKSDITGTVTSLSKDRLEMMPNQNIMQAIQGSIPGVTISTSSAGAVSEESFLVRGRNSITANNDPLIVVDGIPYNGEIQDINPSQVQSIEILRDASSAAIYGSRGANGIILVTTKEGVEGKTNITYDGKFSFMSPTKLPNLMKEDFYDFKMEREPHAMTQTEKSVYEAGEWIDWYDLATRQGFSQQHDLTFSGGSKNISYFIAGSILDVKGIAVNDDYQRITGRINVDAKITDWFKFGTRTQISHSDKSGEAPGFSSLYEMNPLSKPYDEDGKLSLYPWPEDVYFKNPLQPTLYDDTDKSYQVISNNYILVDFPFISGLSYRLNTGIQFRSAEQETYRGRNTASGFEARGWAQTINGRRNNMVIENILNYNKEFGVHHLGITGVYSFEEYKDKKDKMTASGFPHDFLKWYSAEQAELVKPEYEYEKTDLISQMLRINYSYDSRYLFTATGRRDGYSGFGANNKWGFFPSVALGWNISNESFFPWQETRLKLRASWGKNGNQAVGAYESVSRLAEQNMVSLNNSQPGYSPTKLGADNLGWESSSTVNIGLDFGFLQNRISGDLNIYQTKTSDLLLKRAISSIHGINSIIQNIGKTQNKGVELAISSRNIITGKFQWSTTGNLSYIQNKIVSLYGLKNEDGKEIDDIENKWFIGKPILVNYNYVREGVWQTEEAAAAEKWGSRPGFVKLKDRDGNGVMDINDKEVIGRLDPNFTWGMTNTFSYQQFSLSVFMHGLHGVTKQNPLLDDSSIMPDVRGNATRKERWTPENKNNEFIMNHIDANRMGGISGVPIYENASFVRIKDISFSYDFPLSLLQPIKLEKLKLYFTVRNLFTITKWRGIDPELENQRSTPMQKEFVFGINVSL